MFSLPSYKFYKCYLAAGGQQADISYAAILKSNLSLVLGNQSFSVKSEAMNLDIIQPSAMIFRVREIEA